MEAVPLHTTPIAECQVLDLLANRCLADRTNAWTDTDHTCYTVYTAGRIHEDTAEKSIALAKCMI